MNKYIVTYNPRSLGALSLGQAMGIPVVTRDWVNDPGNEDELEDSVLINWGNSRPFESDVDFFTLNHPSDVEWCVDKRNLLLKLRLQTLLYRTVDATSIQSQAATWSLEGHRVYCRTSTTSSRGRGIIIIEPEQYVPAAPLYTKFQQSTNEWRVHITANDHIINIQKKVPSSIRPITNNLIRNENTGWVLRSGNTAPEDVIDQARTALLASGLDFGAVDVLYDEEDETAYVLEINSAPGLGEINAQKYKLALEDMIDEL